MDSARRLRWSSLGLSVPPGLGAVRSLEHFRGTRLVVVEGCGKDGHELVREVTYWFDEHGDLIERRDPKDQIVEEVERD